MANENERHADIIAKMRNEGHTGPADALEWVRVKMTHYAARLEAAHNREVQDALDAGGYVEAARKAKQSGDCAKLREALVRVLDWLKRMNAQPLNTLAVSELTPSYAVNRTARSIIEDNDYHISQLTAALAAPPRNCDRFNTGNPVKDAEDAYGAWQQYCDDPSIPPSCKVESAFKNWLLAPAKEQEGGNNGR